MKVTHQIMIQINSKKNNKWSLMTLNKKILLIKTNNKVI
jgi:hypothetical protein